MSWLINSIKKRVISYYYCSASVLLTQHADMIWGSIVILIWGSIVIYLIGFEDPLSLSFRYNLWLCVLSFVVNSYQVFKMVLVRQRKINCSTKLILRANQKKPLLYSSMEQLAAFLYLGLFMKIVNVKSSIFNSYSVIFCLEEIMSACFHCWDLR